MCSEENVADIQKLLKLNLWSAVSIDDVNEIKEIIKSMYYNPRMGISAIEFAFHLKKYDLGYEIMASGDGVIEHFLSRQPIGECAGYREALREFKAKKDTEDSENTLSECKNEEDEEAVEECDQCVICLTNKKVITLVHSDHTAHQVVCHECSKKITNCPVCRRYVTAKLRIFS